MPASAAGNDGLAPRLLARLVAIDGRVPGTLVAVLTDLVNACLRGAVPDSARPLVSARLTALPKKAGGVRPIAVGLVWRRLVSRVACALLRDKVAGLLMPRQLGVAVRNGAQTVVGAARRFLDTGDGRGMLLKLDFANAFNTVDRQRVLDAISASKPELLPWAACSNASPSPLVFAGRVISSEQKVQQGDPLGPLLFSLTIAGLVGSPEAPFSAWYII